MDGVGDPSDLDPSALVAITHWRRELAAGRDPGPPPVPLPGLLRLERARRFTRHLEQSLGLDEPAPIPPLQLPLSVLLSTQPACPGVAASALPASPQPAAGPGRAPAGERSSRPVFAYRAWAVVENRLRGLRVTWPVPTVTARCLDLGRRAGADPADAPHTDGSCGPPPCGIYATKKAADALEAIEFDGPLALGVVALAGKVVEHERGYRAATATAVGILVVWEGRAVRFDGIEVDELFAVPDQALAAACDRAWTLPAPGPKRTAQLVGELEAIKAGFDASVGPG